MNKMIATLTATSAVLFFSAGSAMANEADTKQDVLAELATEIATEVAAVTLATMDSARVSLQQGIVDWYETTLTNPQAQNVIATTEAKEDDKNQGE